MPLSFVQKSTVKIKDIGILENLALDPLGGFRTIRSINAERLTKSSLSRAVIADQSLLALS
eukprot:4690208-Pleurochrysis_carterae.AAC.3